MNYLTAYLALLLARQYPRQASTPARLMARELRGSDALADQACSLRP